MTTNPTTNSTTASPEQTTKTAQTVQTCIPNNALIEDVLHVLEDNREIASLTHRQKPYFPKRIQTELQTRFDWNVGTDVVRAAVNELGADAVKRCARPHPSN